MAQQNQISQLCAQAIRFHQAGDLAKAETLYRQAAVAEPRAFLPRYLLGAACFHGGRPAEALDHLDAALGLGPDAEAFNIRGLVLEALGRPGEALASYDQALALDTNYAEALNNRGNALLALDRPDDALAGLDRAVALEPGRAQAWSNRAAALHRLGHLDEALASAERSLRLDPRSAVAWTGQGLILLAMNRLAEAVQSYDRAIACDAAHASAHWNKGLCLLLQGRFAEGWPLYEWRIRQPGNNGARDYPRPRWRGEPLTGKTLYLYAEQGLGDTLQFCRYAWLAAAQGARVELSVQDGLVALLRGLGANIVVRGFSDVPARFDFHLPLLSLPGAFATRSETIPSEAPYIVASPDRAAAWARRIGPDGFRIGIAWQGRPGGTVDAGRSFPLARLAEIAALPGVRLISLQKGAGTEQLAGLPDGMRVETLGADFDAGADAFADSAAILAGMDLAITSDTALAHLAGAMNRPVWLALQHVPDWRWGIAGDTTPWYPSMTLFRQSVPGDWAGVFAAMRARLMGRT